MNKKMDRFWEAKDGRTGTTPVRVIAGGVVRAGTNEYGITTFDVAVRGKKIADGQYETDYINGITVGKDASDGFKKLIAELKPGSKVCAVCDVGYKEGVDKEGNPKTFENFYLTDFELLSSPKTPEQ